MQWKRDAQLLSEGMCPGKYQMKVEGKTAQLIVHNVQPEDAGRYSCTAGDEKTSAEVRVKGRFTASKPSALVTDECVDNKTLISLC